MTMQPLDKFELALPRFANDQGLFAEHLNAMNACIETLLLKRFSSRQRGGILQGFAVEIVKIGETKSLLQVSPGLAVDAEGHCIYLPETKKIELPDEKTPAATLVFGVKLEERTEVRHDGNQELGQFQVHTCRLGYLAEEALRQNSGLVEIGRVTFATPSAFISQIANPQDILNPQPGELELREVNWLGETEAGFLRPELQQKLAKLTTSLAAEFPLSQLNLAQLRTLVTTPSFCQRGLLSCEQLLDFISTIKELRKQPADSLSSLSNGRLVQKLYELKIEAPAEICLTKERLTGWIDLARHDTVTVRMSYAPERMTFVLTLQRRHHGEVYSHLADYQRDFRNGKVFHTWDSDQARNQIDYPNSVPPKSLNFYTNATLDSGQYFIKQGLFKCRFQEQSNCIKVEMIPEKVEHWPKLKEPKIEILNP